MPTSAGTTSPPAGADPATLIRLGAILLHLGRVGAAVTRYCAALALDPKSHEATAGLGLALLAEGDLAGGELN